MPEFKKLTDFPEDYSIGFPFCCLPTLTVEPFWPEIILFFFVFAADVDLLEAERLVVNWLAILIEALALLHKVAVVSTSDSLSSREYKSSSSTLVKEESLSAKNGTF